MKMTRMDVAIPRMESVKLALLLHFLQPVHSALLAMDARIIAGMPKRKLQQQTHEKIAKPIRLEDIDRELI